MRFVLILFLTCSVCLCQGKAPPASTPSETGMKMETPAPEVSAEPGKKVTYSSVHVDVPVVALTFDDGPHETLTPKLLDILKAHGAKATFFLLGENAERYPDIVRRIVAEGHEVANHSWSHPLFTKMSDDGVRSQLDRTQTLLKSITGQTPTLMRPPYGGISQRQKQWIHADFGLKILLWSVDTNDWRRPGIPVVTRRVVEGAQPGAIILMHDIHPTSVAAVPEALDGLKARGFRCVTVSELIAMERPVVASASTESPKKAKVPPSEGDAH